MNKNLLNIAKYLFYYTVLLNSKDASSDFQEIYKYFIVQTVKVQLLNNI